MDLALWRLVEVVEGGKRLPDALYVHPDALTEALPSAVEGAWELAGKPDYTLVKLHSEEGGL